MTEEEFKELIQGIYPENFLKGCSNSGISAFKFSIAELTSEINHGMPTEWYDNVCAKLAYTFHLRLKESLTDYDTEILSVMTSRIASFMERKYRFMQN